MSCVKTEVRLLGPVELVVAGEPVTLGGSKQRAVLAMLALEANRPVSTDRLMTGLWDERLPASAPKMVQHYVWQLRRALPPEADARIVTRGKQYVLEIDEGSVDRRRDRVRPVRLRWSARGAVLRFSALVSLTAALTRRWRRGARLPSTWGVVFVAIGAAAGRRPHAGEQPKDRGA